MDFAFAHHGSLTILTPLHEAAQTWVDEYLPADAMTWAGGVVIEPRYAPAILTAIVADGYEIEVG